LNFFNISIKNLASGASITIPDLQEEEIEGSWFKASPGKIIRSYMKNKLKAKGVECVAQVVKYLPSNPEALSSIPNTDRGRRGKRHSM
jgi:hypothetical protein